MTQFIETDNFDLADALAAQRIQRVEQRQELSSALEQIAAEVTVALADVDLEIPVFFTVPSTGEAFVTFMTPADPTNADWSRACDVICGIVGSKVGIENLYSRHLPCVGAGTAAGQ
jgi:hypothetical protein